MLIRLLRERLPLPAPGWSAVVVLQFVSVLAMLYLPSLNARIIDEGVAVGDTGTIVRLGGVMLAVSLQIAGSVGAAWFGARTAMAFGRDLRGDLFRRVGAFSAREVQHFGAPSLITRGTNDVQQVQMLVLMACLIAASSPIMMVGGVVMALREDVGLGWILAVVVPALLVAVGFVVSRMVPSFRLMQGRIDEVNRVLREQITGIRVVRAFVREPHEGERFGRANDDLTEVAVRAGRWMATMFPLVMLVVNVASVGVIWFGGHRVDSGQMQVGALTAFLAYLMQILMSVMMATFMLMQVPRSAVCADRIVEVLDTESSVVPPADPGRARPGPARPPRPRRRHLRLPRRRGAGALRRHPARPARARRSRSSARPAPARPRWSTWCRGCSTPPPARSASAASTCATSTPRCCGTRSGWCRRRPTCSPAPSRSNLRHGQADATEEELWAALEVAQARDFVEALPEGLDAPVAQGGTNFSGGQRQRLAIARAVVRRPGIYLFDDSFSALDLATDARLRAALARSPATRRWSIVAQRVSTIRDADQILVLEDGRVVGRGTHARAAATVRDLPGDRRLPAQRRGGDGMIPRALSNGGQKPRARRSRPPSGSRRPRADRVAVRSAAAWSARRR